MNTYKTFDSHQSAREHRNATGCGGWLFLADDGTAVLFPPDMMPSAIMVNPMTSGKCGTLV